MIRRLQEDDLDAIVALENNLFSSDAWERKTFLYELNENPYAALFVYEEDGVISGYADVWVMYEQAQIADIGVDTAMQHTGIGSKLMKKAMSRSTGKS